MLHKTVTFPHWNGTYIFKSLVGAFSALNWRARKRIANISAPSPKPTQKPRNTFPEWRLPNGTKNAAEDQLETASESCERWEWGCAGLVVVAVIIESIIAVAHPAYDSPFEIWGSAFANAAIALGIVGEVIFGRMDGRIQTELRQRSNNRLADVEMANGFLEESAAMAVERAAKAELETQRLKAEFAWRRLSEEQEMMLRHTLGRLRGASVMIWHFISDPESQNFAEEIAAIFRLAGWKTFMCPAMFSGNFAFDIRVPFRPGEDEAGTTIKEAFTNAGIDFMPLDIPEVQYGTVNDAPLEHLQSRLYVGPKPKPFSIP